MQKTKKELHLKPIYFTEEQFLRMQEIATLVFGFLQPPTHESFGLVEKGDRYMYAPEAASSVK